MESFAKIVVLVDNIVYKQGLRAEHGLSILVKTPKAHILFDCGQTDLLLHNAKALGEDLSFVKHIVISHGHYDHCGGLSSVLNINPIATVWMHPMATESKLSLASGQLRSIGFNGNFDSIAHRIKYIQQPTEIEDNIWILPNIAQHTSYETINQKLLVEKENQNLPDPFNDELVVYLKSAEGIVLISGCAHRGIINTLNTVSNHANSKMFRLILGGTHLNGAPTHRLSATTQALQLMNIKALMLNHCTGIMAFAQLQQSLPFDTAYASVGSVISIAT